MARKLRTGFSVANTPSGSNDETLSKPLMTKRATIVQVCRDFNIFVIVSIPQL